MEIRKLIKNEQGIAFPMAMIVMAILSALMAAFAVLATSEPQIAANHMGSTQARALAESGLERALWALTAGENPTPPGGALVSSGPPNYTIAMVAPYDGSQEVSVGAGSFKVNVADGAQPNIKVVTAVGFVPNATNPIAVKKIVANVTRIKWVDPQCGLCAGGEQPAGDVTGVKVGGSASVNATQSAQGKVPAGQFCSGVTPASAVASTGTVTTNGSPNLYAPPGGVDKQAGATYPSGMLLSDTDMATLKAMAMAKGTYYKGVPPWNGGVPPTNGLVFVDTTDGNVLTNSTDPANIPTLDIHGNGSWSGWLIIAGSLDMSGNVTMSGLIYAQNDITLHGAGGGGYTGAIISTNRKDSSSTNVDATDVGNAPISYNCPAVRNGGGTLSQNWFVMPGTYRETSGRTLP
jgi:hypothetical protein